MTDLSRDFVVVMSRCCYYDVKLEEVCSWILEGITALDGVVDVTTICQIVKIASK